MLDHGEVSGVKHVHRGCFSVSDVRSQRGLYFIEDLLLCGSLDVLAGDDVLLTIQANIADLLCLHRLEFSVGKRVIAELESDCFTEQADCIIGQLGPELIGNGVREVYRFEGDAADRGGTNVGIDAL